MTTNYVASPGASALLDAARWIEGVFQGSAATSIAILAIAALGFSMLRGQLPMRRGLSVVLGCFIFFGASAIVRGITGSGVGNRDIPETSSVALFQVPDVQVTPPTKPPAKVNSDPYAGASLAQ